MVRRITDRLYLSHRVLIRAKHRAPGGIELPRFFICVVMWAEIETEYPVLSSLQIFKQLKET